MCNITWVPNMNMPKSAFYFAGIPALFIGILALIIWIGKSPDGPVKEFQLDSPVALMPAGKPLMIYNMGARKCLNSHPSSDAFRNSDCTFGEMDRFILKELAPKVYAMTTFMGDKCLGMDGERTVGVVRSRRGCTRAPRC